MIKTRLSLPLIPLRGLTVFPGESVHFDVGRPKSIGAVRYATENGKKVFLCYQNDIDVKEPLREDLAKVGTVAEIKQVLNLPDGSVRILVEGITRGRITRFTDNLQYVAVNVVGVDDIPFDDEIQKQALVRSLYRHSEEFLVLCERFSAEAYASLLAIENPGKLADVIAANFSLKPSQKQEILDETDIEARLQRLNAILANEVGVLRIEKQITEKAQESIDANQREYVLREKLRAIREELDEGDYPDAEADKYREEMKNRTLPEYVEKKLNEEIDKMLNMHSASQEYGVIQTYIETILSLPWDKATEDTLDPSGARKILDRDHCGLDKVKERIIEYIAVRKLGGKPKNNILCLVGPPGTGKTSIAAALAEALGRKYVRISLGGVQNESEIRGHRKTYVGAMPGRIIEALRRCESRNPLMLFDEIDKMSRDYGGDPASAMLEVFDPEQNKSFRDHYTELDFDLSDTIFVATANSLDTVPRPLLDRMDIIEVGGYTYEEKAEIAKKHLIPKQRKLHGLTASQLKISPSALQLITDGYTRESGVRSLERKIARICRKAAVLITTESSSCVSVTPKNLADFLGKVIYHFDKLPMHDTVGITNGLAWTESGGDTLCIEVNTMPGSGKIELTGNLGDVMCESAKTALSYVRSCTDKYGIPQDFYKKTDIHIHVPEGAVPKDGPSAGITMATALISALSGRHVNRYVAMTGEITLRGRVLPIGGLKEKTLAAYRMGISTVIIPYENKPDYEELPQKIKDGMSFVFAENMETVLDTALLPSVKADDRRVKADIRYIEAILADNDTKPSITAKNISN